MFVAKGRFVELILHTNMQGKFAILHHGSGSLNEIVLIYLNNSNFDFSSLKMHLFFQYKILKFIIKLYLRCNFRCKKFSQSCYLLTPKSHSG